MKRCGLYRKEGLLDDKIFEAIMLIISIYPISDKTKIKVIKGIIKDRNNLSIQEFVDKYSQN
jgi:hypothetical protein